MTDTKQATAKQEIKSLNSVSIGTFKRSFYLSARYGHFITEEAIRRGWNWNSDAKAFTSAKKEEREWLETRFTEYENQVQSAIQEKESMVKAPFVKFDHKEIAKANGGKWDSENKIWLLPSDSVELVKSAIEKINQKVEYAKPQQEIRKASDKQKAIIRKAKTDWFDLFDGASRYGMYGPTETQLDEMSSSEASALIGDIFAERY